MKTYHNSEHKLAAFKQFCVDFQSYVLQENIVVKENIKGRFIYSIVTPSSINNKETRRLNDKIFKTNA